MKNESTIIFKINLSVIILLNFFGFCFAQTVVQTAQSNGTSNGIPVINYTFDVSCNGIATRSVTVRKYYQTANSHGSVVLTTGGVGNVLYSNSGPNSKQTIDTIWNSNFEVFEIAWGGTDGWATNAAGYGYHIAVNAYTELVRFLYSNNYFLNKDTVFAHGNSGGSFQIAYGLALYNLDTIIDVAILSGGPPVSDLKGSIFGPSNLPHYWPNIAGLALTDFLMGWQGNGDYCINRIAPVNIQNMLDSVSLVSPTAYRNYAYNTHVYFIEGNDPTAADSCGLIYYNQITTPKTWFYFPTINQHNVYESLLGAQKIREIILTHYYNLTTGIITQFSEEHTSIYPNPSKSGYFKIESSTLFPLYWEVYNINGKKIISGESKEVFIENAGMYFLRINNNTIKKIVKIE